MATGGSVGPNGNKTMKLLNKNKLTLKIFIVTSLFAAVVFFIFFAGFKFYLVNMTDILEKGMVSEDTSSSIIERDNNHRDPFITRNIASEEMITEPIIAEDSISLGPEDALVTIVEFSDFQCQYCREQEQVIRDLVENEYPGKVRLVWKDFPINNRNTSSWQASKAARCANEQGSFWEYHDLLYKNNDRLGQELFLELAGELGLNQNIFYKCLLDNDRIDDRIETNIIEANLLGISGIPFLYINGTGMMGKVNERDLRKLIEAELNEE